MVRWPQTDSVTRFRDWVNETPVIRTVSKDERWREPYTLQDCPRDCAFLDLQHESEGDESIDAVIRSRMNQRLNPQSALYDALLIRSNPDRFIFLLRIHHTLSGCVEWRRHSFADIKALLSTESN